MNNTDFATRWHLESYRRFLLDTLPTLVNRRLPVKSVRFTEEGPTCRLQLTIAVTGGETMVEWTLPYPDTDGVFTPACAAWGSGSQMLCCRLHCRRI